MSVFPIHVAAFTPNLIMDDGVFDNVGSMGAANIDNFLNNLPNSCISANSGFMALEPNGYSPGSGFSYGSYVTAGKVIYDAAQAYGINPQVILATLQKEQAIVIGASNFCNNGDQNKYSAAAGYGCPDSGTVHSYTGLSLYERNGVVISNTGSTCVNSPEKAGFSQQVIRAAWLLKFGEQRSEGNISWSVVKGTWDNTDDPQVCYGGPMTQGTWQICPNSKSSYYDGYTTIDGVSTHMDTGATAALYWYTPHFSGNTDFSNIFISWFGGTISSSYYSCHGATNISSASTGEKIINNNTTGKFDNLTLTIPNNTSSSCAEFHTWADSKYQQWSQHIASNLPAFNPADGEIVSADLLGTGKDNLFLIDYRNTGSGMVEVHEWDPLGQRWEAHVVTNMPAVNPADDQVIVADTNGDGHDEFLLIDYRNTGSGMVEVHGWSPNFQTWSAHVVTNLPAVNPADDQVIAAHTTSRQDQLYLIKYRNTGSGMVEVHGWSPNNFTIWASHIATNLPAISSTENDTVLAADTAGTGHQQFLFVRYSNTGSGMVEVHGWSPDLQQWYSHIATSQPEF